jgi:cell division protein FtsB
MAHNSVSPKRRLALKVLTFLLNRYTLVTVLMGGYFGFVDDNSLWRRWRMEQELLRLQEKKAYYEEEIVKTEKTYQNLLNDTAQLEKFAREEYLMKKPDEELFLIRWENDGDSK